MAKKSGLGANFYFDGYDLSGDAGAVQTMRIGHAPLDVTSISKSAPERILGIVDGELGFNTFFNDALLHEHVALKTRAITDHYGMFTQGTTLGDVAMAIMGKQVNYDWTRSADGAFLGAVSLKSNQSPLEATRLLTAGLRTDTGATNGTGHADGPVPTAINITSASAANPTSVLTATAHGLVTGDSVTISGTDKAALNGSFTVTVVDTTHFTVPVDLTGGAATGGSLIKTSTNYGLSAYLQVTAFTGTDVTVKLQDSADNSTWADITGGGFTQVTAAPGAQRIQTTTTRTIRKYVRATTTTSGGVTSVTFAVAYVRYLASPPTW